MMRSPSLNICYWNANSVRNKLDSINTTLNTNAFPIHLLLISESKLQEPDPLPTIPNYSFHSFPHPLHAAANSSRAGGLALYIHRSVRYTFRQDLSTHTSPFQSSSSIQWLQLSAESFSASSPHLLVGLLYSSPTATSHDFQLLSHSVTRALNTTLPIILGGDFNAHHPDWSIPAQPCNPAGVEWNSFVNNQALLCLNTHFIPQQSTFTRPNHDAAVLDLIFISPSLLSAARSLLLAAQLPLSSDHIPLALTLFDRPSPSPASTRHQPIRRHLAWRFQEADAAPENAMWENYRDHVSLLLSEPVFAASFAARLASISSHTPISTSDAQQLVDDMANTLSASLLSAAAHCIPRKLQRSDSKHWFHSSSLQATLRAQHRAHRRKNAHPSDPHAREAYVLARRRWHQVCAAAKAQSLQQLLSKLEEPELHGKLKWHIFKRSTLHPHLTPTHALHSISNPDRSPPASTLDSLNNLAAFYSHSAHLSPAAATPTVVEQQANTFLQHLPPPYQAPSAAYPPLQLAVKDVSKLCERQTCDTAAGPDGIEPQFIRHAPPALHTALTLVYNTSLHLSVVPVAWKLAHVVPLFKGGKLDPTLPSSYRPISLTSILARLLEHALLPTLFSSISSYLDPCQHGFRPQHGTQDNLFALTQHIYAAFRAQARARGKSSTHHALPIAFLDLVKAFDRVDHRILLFRLYQAGVPPSLWRWIRAFLTHRSFRVQADQQHSHLHATVIGVPQGAVLSPVLFSVFINSLAAALSLAPARLLYSFFADDIALTPLLTGAHSYQHLQHGLTACTVWAHDNLMEFSQAKSQIVLFTSQQAAQQPEHIQQYNEALQAHNNSRRNNHTRSRSVSVLPCPISTLRPSSLSASFTSCHLSTLPFFSLSSFFMSLVSSYRYLGVWLQCSGRWEQQTRQVITSATHAARQICAILPTPERAQHDIYPHYKSIRALCMGYLLPKCTYSLHLWRPSAPTLQVLQQLFLRPLRTCLQLPWNTHALSLAIETNTPPMSYYRDYLYFSFLARTCSLPPSHPTPASLHRDYAQSLSFDTSQPAYAMSHGHEIRAIEARWEHKIMWRVQGAQLTLKQCMQQQHYKQYAAAVNHTAQVLLPHKPTVQQSAYLYEDPPPIAALRCALRLDLLPLRHSLHVHHRDVESMHCRHCLTLTPARRIAETREHVLLECSYTRQEREGFMRALRSSRLHPPQRHPLSLLHLLGAPSIAALPVKRGTLNYLLQASIPLLHKLKTLLSK